MSDLISREAALAKVEPDEYYHSNEVKAMLEDLAAVTPEPTWISVKDRLPEKMDDVLVVAYWHERWQTMIGWYTKDFWRVYTSNGEREPGVVTHWMPLPEPPEVGGADHA